MIYMMVLLMPMTHKFLPLGHSVDSGSIQRDQELRGTDFREGDTFSLDALGLRDIQVEIFSCLNLGGKM